MKLSIAFPSIAALILPCIVVADDRHVARFDVTKLFNNGITLKNQSFYDSMNHTKYSSYGFTADYVIRTDPAVRKRIEDTGSIIVANTPAEFAAQMKAELEVYKQVVAKQKLTLD